MAARIRLYVGGCNTGACHHLHHVSYTVDHGFVSSSFPAPKRVCEALVTLGQTNASCPACRQFGKLVFTKVADHIDKYICELDIQFDPTRFPSRPDESGGVKRRLDESFKEFVQSASTKKLIYNGCQWICMSFAVYGHHRLYESWSRSLLISYVCVLCSDVRSSLFTFRSDVQCAFLRFVRSAHFLRLCGLLISCVCVFCSFLTFVCFALIFGASFSLSAQMFNAHFLGLCVPLRCSVLMFRVPLGCSMFVFHVPLEVKTCERGCVGNNPLHTQTDEYPYGCVHYGSC